MREVDAPSLTVAEMSAQGVENVRAFCPACGQLWNAAIDFLPPTTLLAKTSELLRCQTCGGREVEAEPAWPGGAPIQN
jgi:hypothetical protein